MWECAEIILYTGFKIITAAMPILSFCLGLAAFLTWRKQIKYKAAYENALQFEACMTLFAMHTVGEQDVTGCEKLKNFSDQMLPCYWLLLQRNFMSKETQALYDAYGKCTEYWHETGKGVISKELYKELLDQLNAFSLKLRKAR